MKIEIDLNDILGDENGAETLQDSVRRQVIDSMTSIIKKGVGSQINEAVSRTISSEIEEYLKTQMPVLLENLMDAQYTPVGRYGDYDKPTSFRQQLVKSIQENMVYKKTTYSSDRTAFTAAVDSVIEENLKSFKAEFQKQVDAQFTQAAFSYAAESMKKRLGIA